MTVYCGIDLHANNCVVAVLDEQDPKYYSDS
jgi:molecular chaperone DnaK (HSP70)